MVHVPTSLDGLGRVIPLVCQPTRKSLSLDLRRVKFMLWTIAVLLLILWMLGMVSSYTLGGFIHILLVLAIVAVLIRLIQGRNPVA
jgi:asparagine N-glycosylation enzyme membrane subunit Stt3